MQALEKRIAALEVQTSEQQPLTIIRAFVVSGQVAREIERLTDAKGTVWHRLPGETEQAFVQRVKAEAWRNEWGVMVLIGLRIH